MLRYTVGNDAHNVGSWADALYLIKDLLNWKPQIHLITQKMTFEKNMECNSIINPVAKAHDGRDWKARTTVNSIPYSWSRIYKTQLKKKTLI